MGVDFVEIWSVAVRRESLNIGWFQMRLLLKDNEKELGHWCLRKPPQPGQKWILYYSIHLPVSATVDELKAAILDCASTADTLEIAVTQADDN